MKALILGGTGAVGRAATKALQVRGHDVTVVGRSLSPSAGRRLDMRTAEGLAQLSSEAAEHDVVINASGIDDPAIRARAATTPFVETSASSAYLDGLFSTTIPATTVLGAGIAPGVSTLLAASLGTDAGDDIDVAVLLGTGEVHGPAAISWTASLAGTDVHHPVERDRVRNLRERRHFPVDGRQRTHLRADFPDHVLLPRLRVRSYLSLSSRSAVAALYAVGRMPALRGILSAAPHWGSDRWQVTAVHRLSGRARSVGGHGQSLATGEFAALAAVRAAAAPARGAVTMADIAGVDLFAEAETTQLSWQGQVVDAD